MTSIDLLARTLARYEKRLRALERAPRLRNSSLDGASLPVYDSTGLIRQIIGRQEDGSYTIVDLNGPPPPVPSTPIVVEDRGGLVVTWDGRFVDDVPAPADWHYVEVHVTTAVDTPLGDSNQVTTFRSLKGESVSVRLPAVQHFVRFQSVSTSRVESGPSDAAVGTPLVVDGPTSDGLAPGAPAGVVLAPLGIGALRLSWVPVVNGDPVTYDVFLSTQPDFVALDATTKVGEVAGSSLAINQTATGVPLTIGTTYWARVRPRDADGLGPVSAAVSAAPKAATNDEISADFVYAGLLSANAIETGIAEADVVVSGRFLTSRTGQRVEVGAGGVKWYDADDGETPSIDFPTDSTARARVAVDADLYKTTVRDGLSIQRPLVSDDAARLEPGANLLLASTVQPPQAAPQVSVNWGSARGTGIQPSTGNQAYSLGSCVVGTTFYQVYRGGVWTPDKGWGSRVAAFPVAGGPTQLWDPMERLTNRTRWTLLDLCHDGADGFHGLLYSVTDNSYTIQHYTAAFVPDTVVATFTPVSPRVVFIPYGIDQGDDGTLYVTGVRNANIDAVTPVWTFTVRHHRADGGADMYLSTYQVPMNRHREAVDVWPTGNMQYGTSAGAADFGAFRVTASVNLTGDKGVKVFSLTAATLTAAPVAGEHFPAAGAQTISHTWDSTVGRFRSVPSWDISGGAVTVSEHTTTTWTTGSADWWAAYQWRRSAPTYQTVIGPKARFVMKKRARVSLSSREIPDFGGVDDANQVGFFLGRGATEPARTAMWEQGVPSATTTRTLTAPVFTGVNPPAAGTFPLTGVAAVESQDRESYFRGDGDVRFPQSEAYARMDVATVAMTGAPVRLGGTVTHNLPALTATTSTAGIRVTKPGLYQVSGFLRMNPMPVGEYLVEVRAGSGGVAGSGASVAAVYKRGTGGAESVTLPGTPWPCAAGTEFHFYLTGPDGASVFASLGSRVTVARIA